MQIIGQKNKMINELKLAIPNDGRDLAATFTLPKLPEIKGAVLLLHGWVSQRDEVGGIYAELAKQLAEVGIASLRFDFYGCGESSPEHLANLLISSMLLDAKFALNYLYDYAGKVIPIGICGFSLGTVIMALLLREAAIPIKSIVGLSPIVNITNDFSYSHRELIRILYRNPDPDGIIEHDLGWCRILVKPRFIQEFAKFQQELKAGYQNYGGNCLVMGGELDFSGDNVLHFDTLIPHANQLKKEYLPKTDHIFNVFSDNNKAPWIVETVKTWFMKSL